MRPAPPAYPRPVPEIVFEDDCFDVPTEDVDAEVAAELRAAKRRRIQKAAHAYLRGEKLFILSAGLKGPFNKNWKNPWAKRQRTTTNKSAVLEAVPEQRQSDTRAASPVDQPKSPLEPEGRSIREVDITNPFQPTEPPENATSPAQKVEDWLRTNSGYARQRRPSPLSSPTPKTSTENKTKPNAIRWSATPPIRLPPTSSQVPPAPLGQAPSKAFELSQATTTDGMEVANAADAHSRLQSVLQMSQANPALAATRPPSSSCPAVVTDPNKSGHDTELERSTVQQPPFSTDPISTSTSRILRSASKSQFVRPDTNNDSQVGLDGFARPTLSHVQSKTAQSKIFEKPQPSASASGAASIEALPSAQQRSNLPVPVPQPFESEQLLPDIEIELPTDDPTRPYAENDEDRPGKSEVPTVFTKDITAQPQQQIDDTDKSNTDIRPVNTDFVNDDLESPEIPDPSQAIFVTPLSDFHVPEPQLQQNKQPKRTSFAASASFALERPLSKQPMSNSSLKSVLKTSKSSSAPTHPKSFEPPLHEGSAPQKSIPKRNSTSASSALSAAKNHSTIPSGQNVQRLSMGGIEEFDLDAAVDDLGSFLSTWDDEIGGGGSEMGLARA